MFLVSHDAVPGLMDEMGNMAFLAESNALLDAAALRPGDRVRLTVREQPSALLVVGIQKLP